MMVNHAQTKEESLPESGSEGENKESSDNIAQKETEWEAKS